jgi:cell division protein ZipA
MNEVLLYRIIIAAACLLLIVGIWFLGRPRKPGQGRRLGPGASGAKPGNRAEPSLGETLEAEARKDRDASNGQVEKGRIEALERSLADDGKTADAEKPVPLKPSFVGGRGPQASQPTLGVRKDEQFDRIVTLYVAARAGHQLNGPDLVVAAEKAGLVHGHMNIYHRLVDGKADAGPVFSVANMVKPGNFDLTRVQEIRTPGISFFMTLPAPLSALDAWDAMLPTAQRMAELLDALVLDEERNALGRQRIAHIRDEMRAYDRKREQQTIRPSR